MGKIQIWYKSYEITYNEIYLNINTIEISKIIILTKIKNKNNTKLKKTN